MEIPRGILHLSRDCSCGIPHFTKVNEIEQLNLVLTKCYTVIKYAQNYTVVDIQCSNSTLTTEGRLVSPPTTTSISGYGRLCYVSYLLQIFSSTLLVCSDCAEKAVDYWSVEYQ